jgi:sugar phosphate isomerase/epimerase
METTGAIFDPNLLLYFDGVYYRKEQFDFDGTALPRELVVRDKRFTPNELEGLLKKAGFDLVELRPVRSGDWPRDPVRAASDPAAKELLAIAQVHR